MSCLIISRLPHSLALGASLLGLFLFMSLPATVRAQAQPDWNDTGDPLQGAVGLHYGQLGGHGLSFRAPVAWWLYVQVAGGVWHTGDAKRHNLGFNLNYLLRQDQRLRLYVMAGAGYFYRKLKVDSAGGTDVFDRDSNWNLGGGVGIEHLQGQRWSWKVEAAFAHLGRSGDIKVIPQAGLAYYW
jgi:hypothetical protein